MCPFCEDRNFYRSEGGEYFTGSPEAESRHYVARMLWAAHRLRQALSANGRFDLAGNVSALIRGLESVGRKMIGMEPH